MAVVFQSFFLLVSVLAVQVLGQCVSYGIDYANGGEYNIDSTLNEYFSFTTIFQGTPLTGQMGLQSEKEWFPRAAEVRPRHGFFLTSVTRMYGGGDIPRSRGPR